MRSGQIVVINGKKYITADDLDDDDLVCKGCVLDLNGDSKTCSIQNIGEDIVDINGNSCDCTDGGIYLNYHEIKYEKKLLIL